MSSDPRDDGPRPAIVDLTKFERSASGEGGSAASAGGGQPNGASRPHPRGRALNGSAPLGGAGGESERVLREAHDRAERLIQRAEERADRLVDVARAQGERELTAARAEASRLIEEVAARLGERAGSGEGPHRRDPASAPATTVRTESATPSGRARRPWVRSTPPTPTQPTPPTAHTVPTMPAVQTTTEPSAGLSGGRGRWGFGVYRLRWVIIGIGAALLLFGSIFGPGVVEKLSAGGFDVPGSESRQAQTRISQTVGDPGFDVIALYTSTKYTADDPEFKAAVEKVVNGLPKDEQIRETLSYYSTESPAFVSEDKHATYLGIRLNGNSDQKEAFYQDTLQPYLSLDDGVARTQMGGTTPVGAEISDQVAEDLGRAEMLSAPALAVLLLIVFGGLVAAGLPLLVGGLTVVTSFLALQLLMQVTDISVFAINIIITLGLGLSIDYSLLIVSRFREEVRDGHDTRTALARTMTTAGRSVVVSATIVAISLSGLLFFPEVFLRSMTYGGVSAVAVAAISSLTVLPAVLAALGPKVDALRLPFARRRSEPIKLGRHGARRPQFWERLAHAVMHRPVRFAVIVVAVLLCLAAPATGVKFGGIDERQLPASAEGRIVSDTLSDDFGLQNQPILILLDGASQQQVAGLREQIADLPNARDVAVADQEGENTLIVSEFPGHARDSRALELVKDIRAIEPPSGVTMLVGGDSAVQVDLLASIVAGLWKMALLVVLAVGLVLFWAFGSVVLPIKAVLMTMLTVLASFGVIVLVFQHGWGSGLLNFESTGFVEATQPILMLAILFGLTTDYEVFLLSRVRERWDAGDDNTTAVAVGMQRTGPIITSAAALILVVIAAFSTSEIVFVKLIGVGMAVSILLDATVVRGLLVPATMRLLGRWNWWAPKPVAMWWAAHRPAAEELERPAKTQEPAAST